MGRRDPLRQNQDPALRNIIDAVSAPPPVLPVDSPVLRAFSVGTAAELRITLGSTDGNGGPRVLLLAGQFSPLDAGAGVFVWDPTSTLADNATTTASAFTVCCPATLTATKGRWRRLSLGGGSGITQLTGGGLAGPGSGSQVFTLHDIPDGCIADGKLAWTLSAAPAAPSVGTGYMWFDSSNGMVGAKNSAGTVSATAYNIAVATSKWLSSFNASTGTWTQTQPGFSDLTGTCALGTQASGTLQAAQFPALTGNVTTTAGSLATSLGALTGAVTSVAGALATSVGTIPGRFVARQVLTSGTTYTPTNGTVKQQMVQGWAGGGGGGGANTAATSDAFGGGGASGGYFWRLYAITTTGTFAIGGAGTAGVAAAGTGGTGGNTTFTDGTTLCTAFGGLGGVGMSGAATALVALGGASGAVSTNGTVNGKGSPGGFGIRINGVAGGGVSGSGASYMYGGGANGTNVAGAGAGAVGFASGGAGGCVIAASAAAAGGAGTQGLIIIDEFT